MPDSRDIVIAFLSVDEVGDTSKAKANVNCKYKGLYGVSVIDAYFPILNHSLETLKGNVP